MEGPLLDEWNAKFGVKPPEWVHSLQDVDQRISECRLRIESLHSQLNQEYFLLDWLQVVSAKTDPEEPEAEISDHSETENHVELDLPEPETVSPVETQLQEPESNEPSEEDLESTENAPKPSVPIEKSNSLEESTKSRETSPDSSTEYYSARLYSSQETTESPVESEGEAPSVRRRLAHRVNSSDVKVARTVRRKLVKEGHYQSWSCLDHQKAQSLGPRYRPFPRRRSLSDPALNLSSIEQSRELPGSRYLPSTPSPLSSPSQQQRALHLAKKPPRQGEVEEVSAQTSEVVVSTQVDSQDEHQSAMLSSMEGEGELSSSSAESSLKDSSNTGGGKRQSNGVLEGFGYSLLQEEDSDVFNVMSGLTSAQVRNSQSHQLTGLMLNGENAAAVAAAAREEGFSAPPPEFQPAMAPLRKKSTGSMSHRSSAYLDDDQCSTPRGEVDPTMTLIRGAVENELEEKKKSKSEEEAGEQEEVQTKRRDDYQQQPLRLSDWDLDMEATLSKFRDAPEMSMATLIDVRENDEMCALLPSSCSNPLLSDMDFDDESIEIDDALISAYTLRSDIFGSRSNSTSSIPGLFTGTAESLSSTCSSPPPELVSPTQVPQGVSLRTTSGGGGRKHRDRKRMGNAELDMISVPSQNGSDSSPSHTASSQSSASPLSDGGGSSSSLPLSPLSPYNSPAVTSTPLGAVATTTQTSGTDEVLVSESHVCVITRVLGC